jgi:hypothetical protein
VETSPVPSVGAPGPTADVPGGPPLPPDSALVDVMSRLADPAVPGEQKITLIESGTAQEAAGLDRFAVALRDNGSLPLTFEARDLAWSSADPGSVMATVVINTAGPQAGQFSYPMEFAPGPGGSWKLTRKTADLVLDLGAKETAPPPPPGPPPPVPPAPPR